MQVVKNDFLAGLERDGRYKLLQVHYALMLEREYPKDADPRALPQHGLLRQQRLRHPGRRRDVLRQDRRPADVHRGGVPRRARAGAVDVRPDQQPRAQPRPVRPGARPPRRRRRRSPRPRRRRWPPTSSSPSGRCASRSASTPRTYFTEALRDYLLNRSNILGGSYEERYSTLFRGGLRIHTTFDPTCSARPRRPATSCPTRRRASTPRSSRSTRAPARSGRWSAGAASCPTSGRRTWRWRPRQTGSSIKFFILAAALQAGAQPDDVIDGSTPCILPNPDDPTKPFEIKDAAAPRGATCGT